MSLEPRLRMRAQTVTVQPTLRGALSNEELLGAFLRSVKGRVAKRTHEAYRGYVRDALRYFTNPDGSEKPVREWGKADVWAYVHFMESSYCANFLQLSFTKPARALCKAGAWEGPKEAAQAAGENCSTCPLFKRQAEGARKRLAAINRFFKFLSSVDAIPANFVRDVASEHGTLNPRVNDGEEKKRNPTMPEMVRLVNETAHTARRAFYAASAKWACRPNEMLILDRYASFGLAMPEGCQVPPGFESGFLTHPEAKPFNEGGQLAYLPKKRTVSGEVVSDKRTGNRWLVIDAELRPIIEQYFAWWDRKVKRDPATGRPLTTRLWLKDTGVQEGPRADGNAPNDFSERWFYKECERLGLMRPTDPKTGFKGDRADPRRRWAAHCQRHFSERVRQTAKVPADWCNHFRGDAFRDARGSYYVPEPLDVLKMYLELMPRLGFKPLPEAPRLAGGVGRSEEETHRQIVTAEGARVRGRPSMEVATVAIDCLEAHWVVPARLAGSCLFAARKAYGEGVSLGEKARRRVDVAGVCERALKLLA